MFIKKEKEKKVREKIIRTGGEKIVFGIVFALFMIYSISMLYPIFWMIVNSFKDYTEFTLDIYMGKVFDLPDKWLFKNYITVFSMIKTPDGIGLIEMLFNNIWQACLPLITGTICSTYFAYVMSRFEFRGRNLLYAVVIFTFTIPVIGNGGAAFKLISDLGLYNNPLYYIINTLGFGGMGFMIYYGFFKNIPYSYAEAVYIDGGGEYTVFFKIILPQATPIITALCVGSFIGSWNDYLTPLLYMPSYPSLASGMYLVKNTLLRSGRTSIYYAGLVATTIPVIIMFLCFSDTIMNNMSIGGLKG